MKREWYLDEWKGEKIRLLNPPALPWTEHCTKHTPPTHPKDARDRFNIPVLLNVERPHSVFTCWTVPFLAKLQPEDVITRQMQQCSIHRIMGWRNPVLQMLAEYGQRETPPVNSRCSYSTRKNNSIGKREFDLAWFFFLFFSRERGVVHHAVVWKNSWDMAGAQSGVHVVQLKPIVVPQALQEGNKVLKWDDVSWLSIVFVYNCDGPSPVV